MILAFLAGAGVFAAGVLTGAVINQAGIDKVLKAGENLDDVV